MEDEQEKYLEEALSVVRQESLRMHKALDESNMTEALKSASILISELKTSLLSPKTYYELYMQVFDNLSQLEGSFMDEYRRGRKVEELYRQVQHNPNILPRLYLLITVGSVYIRSNEKPASVILKDLIEMTKGVQHPVRGLFLRYYLNKMCKDKLPDSNNEEVTESMDFLLQNLSEMNRLWIRMQHTGNVRDKPKREKERSDLRVTVGENIVRLSSLDGITIQMYKQVVLPRILEVIATSKDMISQQYLMDCIIQAFPDEYHLQTLEPLLEASTQLQSSVEIKSIFINLLTRLADHAGEAELQIVREINIFELIRNYIDKIVSEGNPADTKKLLQMEVAFLRLSLRAYPDNTDNVNNIFDSCMSIINKNNPDGRLDPDSLKALVKLLSFPLETLSLAILSMPHYPQLMGFLQFNSRKQVASKIVVAVVSAKKPLDETENLTRLLSFITSLLEDSPDSADFDNYEFEEEQNNAAKLVHLINSEDPETYFNLLDILRQAFSKGGPRRMKFTLQSLIIGYIKFLVFCSTKEATSLYEGILENLLDLTSRISDSNPQTAISLNLQCLLAMNNIFSAGSEFEETAYEFGARSLVLFQDEITDPEVKHSVITTISSTMNQIRCLEEDNLDTLVSNCAQYAAKLGRNQCQGLLMGAQLFWNPAVQDHDLTFDRVQKAVTVSQRQKNTDPVVYLEILNAMIQFFDIGVQGFDAQDINKFIAVIRDKVKNSEEGNVYWQNTVAYVNQMKSENKLAGISF